MKSSYELAMERLAKEQGATKSVTASQKAALAEVDSRLTAKLAEIDILFAQKLAAARASGDPKEIQRLQEEKTHDISRAKSRAEDEKDAIRAG